MFEVRRKIVKLAVIMSVQYSDNRMNQRKLYETAEEMKGVETGVNGRSGRPSSVRHFDVTEQINRRIRDNLSLSIN
jgi:hypothetical protein